MDALTRYTRQRGGWSLSSPYMEGFKCQALAFGMGEAGLQETRFAFQDSTQVCTVRCWWTGSRVRAAYLLGYCTSQGLSVGLLLRGKLETQGVALLVVLQN